MVGASQRRREVAEAQARGLSQRRACALFRVARAALCYTRIREVKDAPLIARLRELSARHPRYGYRFMRALLAQENIVMGNAKCYRLWRNAGLQVPRKRRRRRCGEPTLNPRQATRPGQLWAMDFVLNAEWFRNRVEAKVVIEAYRIQYNTQRPHSALGYLTPAAFKRKALEAARSQNF